MSRAVQVLPNKVLSTLGVHSTVYPVDNLALNHDRTLLVSSSYDAVKFWSTSEIPTMWTKGQDKEDLVGIKDDNEDDNDDEEEEERERRSKRKKRKRKWQKLAEEETRTKKSTNFFDDL